jgi:hypothetical protein
MFKYGKGGTHIRYYKNKPNTIEIRDVQILIAVATKFCTLASNIFGPFVWNLPHDTLLAPNILR